MAERLETPERYSAFLKNKGGTNPFNEPMFILVWGRSPIYRLGVPDAFLGSFQDCWCLAEWKPPEEFGFPQGWDERFWGPYPSRGMYVPIQVFRDGNVPCMIDSEGLNLNVLEMFLWVILNHERDSMMKRNTFLKDAYAQKQARHNQELIDRIEDGAPAFAGPCSFTGQLNVNSVIKQKMDALERGLPHILNVAKRFPRGGTMVQPIGG